MDIPEDIREWAREQAATLPPLTAAELRQLAALARGPRGADGDGLRLGQAGRDGRRGLSARRDTAAPGPASVARARRLGRLLPGRRVGVGHRGGPAVTAAIRALRAEPMLPGICRAMRKGILAHGWTRDPAVRDYLDTVKPAKRDRMSSEREVIRERYLAVAASERFAVLPEVSQRLYHVLYAMSGDPELGGPDIMASVRVLVVTLHRLHGHRYEGRSITYAWHRLEEAGILTVTPGVAYQGFTARVRMLFREAVEVLRRLWYKVMHTGGRVEWEGPVP